MWLTQQHVCATVVPSKQPDKTMATHNTHFEPQYGTPSDGTFLGNPDIKHTPPESPKIKRNIIKKAVAAAAIAGAAGYFAVTELGSSTQNSPSETSTAPNPACISDLVKRGLEPQEAQQACMPATPAQPVAINAPAAVGNVQP